MRELMEQRLQMLDFQVFEFQDESHLHAGHAGNRGGGHYAIVLVSERFAGVSRLQRQRMVQDLLADLFASQRIHALSMTCQTPEEYFSK